MRITFLVNYDLSATWALNYLVPRLAHHTLSIFYTRKPAKRAHPPKLEAFMAFEAAALETLRRQPSTTACVAIDQLSELGCENVAMLNAVNDADYDQLEASQPELIVSIRHMTILKEPVYTMPRLGVLNLHSGVLPTYQGVMSSFWAMLNQEPQLGTTLHFIEDTSIDTGSVITQTSTRFEQERSYLWNVLNLYQDGCDAILSAVQTLSDGEQVQASAQTGTANYYTYPDESALLRFAESGFHLFAEEDPASFNLTGPN